VTFENAKVAKLEKEYFIFGPVLDENEIHGRASARQI